MCSIHWWEIMLICNNQCCLQKALAPMAKGLPSVVEVLKKQLTLSESTMRDLREEVRRLQRTVEQLSQENRELKNTIQVCII